LAGEPGDALGAEIDRNDHQPVRRARAGSPRVGSRGGRRSSWVVGRRSSVVRCCRQSTGRESRGHDLLGHVLAG
jgi:hypothetical protein